MESNRDTSGSTGQLSSGGSTGVGGMHHSHSSPAGVDGGARTPPATPKKGGKMLAVRVQMLDDTVTMFQVQAKAMGKVLFEQVCKQLHLLEADYFGLEYHDLAGTRYWLDLQKPISRQLGLSLVDPLLYFCVKFYTPDPAQLEEEYTRYLFCLQVKRDLSQGLLQCNDNTAALMASYIVQAECGDFVLEDYPDHTYLSSYKFVPHQDQEMERKIMENHKKHSGQSPAEADLNLLETARRCELYGMKMHPAKDHENVPLNLAVAHMGIVVFQHFTKINTFSWAKIRKISFKRKRFLIKLHPEGYGYYKDTVEFFFEGRNECKNFWKKCVEHHGFFRCSSVKTVSRHKTKVLSRGSSFRYSGKTQKEIVEFVRDNYVKRQAFQRSASFRHTSAHSSASNMHASTVGNSISAHPLLPLADSNLSVEASKLSGSLGSMGAALGTPGSPTTKSASHPRAIATSWNSAPDTRPAILPVQTTTSPSPPLTTQSGTPVTSATTSPHHVQYEPLTQRYNSSSPVAVHAAVHRADTGITRTRITVTRMPSSHKSEGSLDQSPLTNNHPTQTQSQNDLLDMRPSTNQTQISSNYTYKSETALPKRHVWHRSASCRELYDFNFEESGRAKPIEKIYVEERKLESPITRYDDHHPLYTTSSRNTSLEMHQDIVPDQKVYSSSYPGTTSLSQESVEDPGNYELRDSQDDLSHDSYELLERSDDDYSTSGDYKYHKTKTLYTRSCSLDSGNYLPSDSDSEERYHKCKSSSDIQHGIFTMDDPRDYPREKIPRKSDGSYYKTLKLIPRTSSLESKSDYCDTKTAKPAKKTSRTSSQESKSDAESKRNVRKNKSMESLGKKSDYLDSMTSSLDSRSDYFDAHSKIVDEPYNKYHHEFDRKIQFERNYGTQKIRQHTSNAHSNPYFKETSHVHSVSLQNVKTDHAHSNHNYNEQNTVPRTQKPIYHFKSLDSEQAKPKTTHIWPETIVGVPTEIRDVPLKSTTSERSTESESNIFSFDEDRIQSLQEEDICIDHTAHNANIESRMKIFDAKRREAFREIFEEIEPKKLEKGREPLLLHQPIERTKSDPNSLARQRLNSNARRHLLMHQKSIDLTPAESSDDDYLYKQIPSAPPIMKYRGSRFEMPTAEFGHFDILKREVEGQKTKFEVPKSQFEVLGAKTQSDLVNLPPKNDEIPYILHKRHVMNGTSTEEAGKLKEKEPIKDPHLTIRKLQQEVSNQIIDELKSKQKTKLKSPLPVEGEGSFLFTQNIDLSKVDPVTLEVDKTILPVHHMSSPKRDITRIDPALLEALSSKLSQIESDSPTSSKTESLKPDHKMKIAQILAEESKIESKAKVDQATQKCEVKATVPVDKLDAKPKIPIVVKDRIKTDIKPKRVIKPRMQPNKKGAKTNKTKVRITSFSSDDESLDSDDVFGTAEATPTKMEYSPPQPRKEMEAILKIESERKYLQYTMSSTEVEGSPPQTRKADLLHCDPSADRQSELRRISERSISIPSSEDDFNIKTSDLPSVFAEPATEESLSTVAETEKELESPDKTIPEQVIVQELCKDEKDDEEKEKEKALLQSEIEHDLKDLKVPPKTKITEICSPSSRRKGQSPLLFAHARLNLSEGSAFSLLQKQQATESLATTRRARSLDTPVISVNRLPALNAFSSKDDTVEEEEQVQKVKEPELKEIKEEHKEKIKKSSKTEVKTKLKVAEKDQIVPDVTSRFKKTSKPTVALKPKPTSKIKTNQRSVPSKEVARPEVKLPQKVPSKPPKLPPKPQRPASLIKTSPKSEKPTLTTEDAENSDKSLASQKSSPGSSTAEPDGKESSRRPKEKARSFEKLELKRISSKERTKSQEDSDTEIAKRKEKQQMLYEIAIKQTKTVKSPVKDILPVFPQVEEMVRERHGKLEISINTIENPSVSLEEAIIITKSPKRLDKKMDKKLTKSLELNLTEDLEITENGKFVQRLGKSLDLDNRPKEEDEFTEFDFQPEAITNLENQENATEESAQNVILKGTSLDVWLSLGDNEPEKLEDITVIQKSDDFFEKRLPSKPPDLAKIDTKSSSDSQSLERLSLGNSLDIKYIDESGDSSHKSEQDAGLVEELHKASETVRKLLLKKLERRRKSEETQISELQPEGVVKTTSDDESLTEVSDLKCEAHDPKFLSVNNQKDALLKLSIERSRSEDTGSWMTVECEEYIGTEESFDYDIAPLDSPERISAEIDDNKTITEEINLTVKEKSELMKEVQIIDEQNITKESETSENLNLLTTGSKTSRGDLLKRSSDQSRSSDTTGSWTSGEKDLSPGNVKEAADESSVSCSMGQTIGLSPIERFASLDQLEKMSPDVETPRSPRSPRICVLGRAFTIDESMDPKSDESLSDGPRDTRIAPIEEVEEVKSENESVKYKKSRYPFEEKWSNDSELGQRIHEKIAKKLSSAEKSSLDESEKRKDTLDKPSLHSFEKLSTESKNSFDTESSSGSLGVLVRLQKTGELPLKEPSPTWRPFPLESSGSSSLEEGILPTDQDVDQDFYLHYAKADSFVTTGKQDSDGQDDLSDFPTNFGYPCLTSGGIGLNIGADLLAGYGTSFLGRTLSRISERSTNSEKSSLDEDVTKASSHSNSLNDESLISSDHQGTLSSDTPSHAHVSNGKKTNGGIKKECKREKQISDQVTSQLLQRQISDDRRTSAEMADLSMDEIEIISERGLKLKRQESDDTIIDDEREKKGSSSQESEEWPLPDIPRQNKKSLLALHETPSSDTSQQTTQVFKPPSIPKTFGLRGSLRSQDSEPWPSPPSSILDPPITGSVETYYMTPPEEACKVTVDSNTVSTYDNDSYSDNENKTLELDADKSPMSERTYENVAPDQISESISESLSAGPSGVKIVLEKKSDDSGSSSEDDLNISNLNDDVFVDTIDSSKNELRPPTVLRRSTTSDDSSHSGRVQALRPPSRKGSHSSYSEEECTSSMGTNVDGDTVRFALKPTKCTHSSHSEDTSIALSLSEWSNSTNTVKFQNLSSNSGTTKSSNNNSGLKSDDNSLTDIAQSISEWSNNSNKLKGQQGTNLQFQKLSSSNSTGEGSTLTDLIPTISEWSSSDNSKTLVPQQFFVEPPVQERQSISRLGSSVDDLEVRYDQKSLKSPQNIPSEDLAIICTTVPTRPPAKDPKLFLKSTERPIMIPVQLLSDTDKSTESSSMEQRTVHIQRYEKPKQKYLPSSKSTERPVKVPLAKCSPYYSSSLSSESTPMTMSKTATVPLTRSHRKPVSKSLFQTKSPPSENDSTSSVESPKSTPEFRDRRGYRRRRQVVQKRHKVEKERHSKDDYFIMEPEISVSDYNEYVRNRNMEELAYNFHYETVLNEGNSAIDSVYVETLEEGYLPDGDSQSGSDIFRMDEGLEERFEVAEAFDVSSIPPPLLEDDFEDDRPPEI